MSEVHHSLCDNLMVDRLAYLFLALATFLQAACGFVSSFVTTLLQCEVFV